MKKRIINKYFLIALSAGALMASCSKSFVTKNPNASLPFNEALDTSTVLGSDLNAVYAELRGVDQYGRDWPVLGDLMADNTFLEARNSGRYLSQFGYTVPITDGVTQSMWQNSYQGVLYANQIIDANVNGADDIKAQAYALRALLYFKMVNIWGKQFTVDSSSPGVPLVLHYDVTLLPGRASVGTVYNQIVSDLITALQHAPQYSSSVTLSYYAIEGLLAKVYMYMGRYQDALTAAQDVIDNSGFTLVSASNFLSFWADPGIHTDQVEVMFEEDCDAINNNGFDDLGGIYINGYQDLYCSIQLANLYSNTDVRGQLLLAGATKGGASAFLVNKYPNAQNSDRDNPKVLRIAEVYLIAAECENRLGDDPDAQTYANDVAQARDAAFTGYTSTGQTLLMDIATERRKELAFEGDRLYDMNRLGLPIVRASNPGSAPSGDGLTIPYPDDRRIAPIPQQEILRNPTLASQQNPGY
ncbi:MAG TPA: RagB/SusD family nutrient uptake outer membrane protein [Puia sp.]|nr:RagB/SusD family nutrient uptake outer membrane protein [Puia sp.]